MKQFKFTLENEHGLHARPASMFVKKASEFNSEVFLIKNGNKFNCKSVMGILKMGASKGDSLTLEVNGEDQDKALLSLKEMIEAGFYE